MSKRKLGQISWFTPPGIGASNGYGYAAVEMIKALQSRGVDVPFQSNNLDYNKQTSARCHISFVQPPFYQGEPEQYRIGFSPWESSQVPAEWIPRMRAMDEIWTPATWVADIYNFYEVNSVVRFIPHGFNPEIWKIYHRYEKNIFTFFHVGGPTERKGGQRVVDAFLDLFEGNDSVRLVLKSHGSSECRVRRSGNLMNAAHHPQITVVYENIDVEDLANLYFEADCLVYPTNGEGFGLIPFQGMATGLPTIVTDATACSDFAEYGFPLRATPTPGYGVHLGDWYEPDPVHLRELMLYVFENFDKAKEHAMRGAYTLHNSQTWSHVADMMLSALGDKIYERI